MTQRKYRTAQGRNIDLGALMLKNENVRAVGNIPVNARGDYLDANNRPIQSKPQQVTRQQRRQVTNVTDEPVLTSAAAKPPAAKSKPARQQERQQEPEATVESEVIEPAPVEAQPEPEPDLGSGGLAAAIARARHIQQEPMLDPRTRARQNPGVNKI